MYNKDKIGKRVYCPNGRFGVIDRICGYDFVVKFEDGLEQFYSDRVVFFDLEETKS